MSQGYVSLGEAASHVDRLDLTIVTASPCAVASTNESHPKRTADACNGGNFGYHVKTSAVSSLRDTRDEVSRIPLAPTSDPVCGKRRPSTRRVPTFHRNMRRKRATSHT